MTSEEPDEGVSLNPENIKRVLEKIKELETTFGLTGWYSTSEVVEMIERLDKRKN